VPARLHVDERQLAQDVRGHRAVPGRLGERPGPVQHHGALAVEAAHRVDQRAAECAQDVRLQCGVAGALSLLGGPAQRLDAGVDRAGVQGGRPGSEQRARDDAGAYADAGSRDRGDGGRTQRRRRHQPLPGERGLAQREVHGGPSGMPRGDHGAQEQLLR
jgi:hypothetical protein